MGKYNFDVTLDHTKNDSFRWEQVNGRNDIIGMGTADLDYFCAPCIKEATKKVWEENTFNYRMRTPEYFNSIVSFYKRLYNLDVKTEWAFNVPSTLGAVRLAIGCVCDKGDKIIVQTPCFGPIASMIDVSYFKRVENPMKIVDGHYEIDFEDFEKKIKEEKPKAYIMVNPHNPTGRVFTKEELTKLVDICYENDVKIISDEVHSIIVHGNIPHTPIFGVSEKAKEISFQIVSLSKGFNVMSMPHSIILVADEKLRDEFRKQIVAHSFGYATNSFALAAVTSVLKGEADEWLKEVTEYIKGNVDYALDYIEKYIPKMKAYAPEGSFLIWADVKRLNIPKEDVAPWFVEHAGITLDNGLEFGEEGAGYIRINIAVTRKVLEEAMDRLRKACE